MLRELNAMSPGLVSTGSAVGSRSPCSLTRDGMSRCPQLWLCGTTQRDVSGVVSSRLQNRLKPIQNFGTIERKAKRQRELQLR